MKMFQLLLLSLVFLSGTLSATAASRAAEQRMDAWRQAAVAGDVKAAIHLGDAYANGRGLARNLDEAAHYYCMAAEQNSEMALLKLQNLPPVYSAKWLKQLAEQGDENALRYLAESYTLELEGRHADWESAAHYYGAAADAGDELALKTLQSLPYEHTSTWWEEKAFDGDAQAAFFAGESYEQGRGITVNIPQAVRFYAMASEAGNTVATERLQHLPVAETASWWDYRAMKGDLAASLYLAQAYGTAQLGVPKVLLAAKYIILAAAQGDRTCLYALLAAVALLMLMLIIRPLRGFAFAVVLLLLVSFAVLMVV